jgi:predicted GNAT superfamily acetyltransferase
MIPTQRPQIRIREISDYQDLRDCLKLQQEVWGRDFTDQVPPAILMVATKTGGLVLGAFVADRLVGFVFSLAGWEGDRKIHWSDMLAVRKSYRNRQIGFRLKQKQRQILRKRGAEEIYWTFDPLESKNAYFNFEKLGVVVEEYLPNLYGITHSPLHRGLETDRFLAVWRIQGAHSKMMNARRRREASKLWPIDKSSLINRCSLSKENLLIPGSPNLRLLRKADAPVRVYYEIPADIRKINQGNPNLGRQWQHHTRTACLYYLKKGFAVRRLIQATVSGRKRLLYEFSKRY